MANACSSIIKDLVLEDVHDNFPINPYVHKTINFLQSSNLFLYRHTYRITTYVNPRDVVIVGGVLYSGAWLLGFSSYLKFALYIKCALGLFEKYQQLYQSCQDLNDAIHFKYPIYHVVGWESGGAGSPSMRIWWKTTIKSYQQQTLKVIKCTLKVLVEIFKLGLYLRDLYLLTQNDSSMEFYACSELADDLSRHCTNLEKNLRLLSEELISQEAIGNRLMQKMGVKFDMSTLINKMKMENPKVFNELIKQGKGLKEDFRSLVETGNVDFRNELEKPNLVGRNRFIPYCGQPQIDAYIVSTGKSIFIDF